METPPHAASTSYPLHQVIPAENIMVHTTPPSAAQLLLQHLPSAYRPNARKTQAELAEEYRLKYMTLKKKCHGIQLGNEKLLNRMYHVRKAVRKLTRERRFLMSKLDEFGDDYKSAQLPIPIEDESVLSLLSSGSNLPSTYSPPKEPSTSGTKRSASPDDTVDKVDVKKPSLAIKTPTSSPAGTKRRRSSTQKADKDKDPNAPKKPANAFLMFCQHERLSVLDEYSNGNPQGEMSHQDLTKELAKKWNDLTAEQKKTYYTLYEQDKRRYEREMRQYRISENRTKTKPQSAATTTITSTINTTTASSFQPVRQPAITQQPMPHLPITQQPASIALSTITQAKLTTPVVTSPFVTAPSIVQTPPGSIVVKQEPMNNNNNAVQASLGEKQMTPSMASMVTPRTLPLSSITLAKPSASSSATGHSLVTLTTATPSTSVIPGTTSYIKLSLGPNLTLAGNPSLLIPPKTASGSVTVPKTSFPVTLTTKPSGAPPLSGFHLNKQAAVVTQISRQAVVKPSGHVSLVTTSSRQQSKVTKTKAQSTISSRLGGNITTATKGGNHVTMITKSSSLGSMAAKKNTQSFTKTSGVTVMASKTSGIGTMASLALATKTGVIPTSTGKIKGPSTKTSGLSSMVPKTSTQTTSKGPFILTSKSSGALTVGSKGPGQNSGLIFTGSKTIGQGNVATKLLSQPIVASKVAGQAVFSLPGKLSGQSVAATTKGGQAATTTKLSGQVGSVATKLGSHVVTTKAGALGTIASRLSGQGATLSGQGISAAAVLSRLAAPGRASGEGVTISSTVPSRVTTTTMHGGTSTHLSVVKETKKLLTGQKPSTQVSSLLKKTPEPMSKSDDPYHFDD